MEKNESASLSDQVIMPSDAVKLRATIRSIEEYQDIYQRSIEDPENFWGGLAEQLSWYKV